MRTSLLVILTFVCISSVLSRECERGDFIPQYTACDSRGYRNVIYYKNPSAQCTIGTYQPQNQFNLLCNITCNAGEYLPIGQTSCSPCQAGTYSLGGGIRLSDWNADFAWDSWEPQGFTFRTFCLNNSAVNVLRNCTAWKIENGFIHSGDTDDSMISVLELGFRMITPGYIRFVYQVDAERYYDGLRFLVDNTEVMPKVSVEPQYVEFKHNLSAGVHTVTWEFIKDQSESRGDDRATIKTIEVKGLSYADDDCALCPKGYFSSARSTECQICPADTKAPQEGSPQCLACDANQYSYPGSAECQPRPPCTHADYEPVFTPCRAPRVRDMTFVWIQPKICSETVPNAVQLPQSEFGIDCAPCNPGFYRPAMESTFCSPCPNNTKSGANAIRCFACNPGEVAPRKFIMRTFEEWPHTVRTSCSGDCGTPGWRLRYDHIDSGEGHGRFVSVYFGFNVTLEDAGKLQFKYQFNCTSYCTLQVSSTGRFSRSYLSLLYGSEIYDGELSLEAGRHELSFYFQAHDNTLDSRNDKVNIYGVDVTNVAEGEGGAETCEACTSGYFAATDQPRCLPCGPGKYSDTTHGPATRCFPCPANTFAEGPTSDTCLPCGERTNSTEGSSECYTNCTFSIASHNYDLNPLKKSDADMYGPIYDQRTGHIYYLNVCTKQHSNHSCFDRNGDPIPSFACQLTNNGYGVDLGHVIGFTEPVNAGPRDSFVVQYTQGTLGCAGRNNSSPAFPRSSTVTFVCDDEAGVGYPEAADNGIEQPDSPCAYHFKWRTAYACPLCTHDDYTYYYTECKNGLQSKIYSWKKNPKVCHDGVSLPQPVHNLDCTEDDKVICKPGEHKLDVCTGCPFGQFSIGGGDVWQDWTTVPAGFSLTCSGTGCTNWQPKGSVLVSGSVGSSVTLTVNFVRPGIVRTQYSGLLIFGQHLTISLDGQVATKLSKSSFEGDEHLLPVDVGTHRITWSYTRDENAPANQQDMGYVVIRSISAVGTKWNDGACVKCRPGYYQQYTNSTSCRICPRNTYTVEEGHFECSPCPEGTYSPAGWTSATCLPREPCTEKDYIPVFTQCLNGFFNQTYKLKRPVICKETTSYRPPAPVELTCSCPTGQFRNSAGLCESCQPGYSYKDGQCTQAQRGSAALLVKELFPTARVSAGIPCAQDNGCYGDCRTSWRVHPDGISSGIINGPGLSYIDIPIEMATDGSMNIRQITITPANQPKNFFQIFLDDTLVYHTTRNEDNLVIPIRRDNTKLSFVWHQTTTGEVVVVRPTITGATDGVSILRQCPAGSYSDITGATTCTPCRPGTAADKEGSVQCKTCEPNTYAATNGSRECMPCGVGSYTATSGSSFCQTSCNFTLADNILVNLNALQPTTVETVVGNKYTISLCSILDSPTCVDSQNANLHTHVCVTKGKANRGTDYGKNFNFASLVQDGLVRNLNITLDYGEECPKAYPTDPVRYKKSTITLYCDVSKGVGEPVLNTERTKFTDQCEDLYFDWYTAHACKICQFPEDFENLGGSECTDKKQTVSYGPKNYCINTLYATPHQQEEACTPQGFSTLGVVIGITVFILLVAVMATGFLIIYMKNRKLTAQYSLLKDAHANRLDVALDDSDNEL